MGGNQGHGGEGAQQGYSRSQGKYRDVEEHDRRQYDTCSVRDKRATEKVLGQI